MNFTIGNLLILLLLPLAVYAGNANGPADDPELRNEFITESYSAFQQPGDNEKDTRDPDRIQPYINNPRYWQYKGEPVLLLGGTVTDNLFQINHLQSHLDSIYPEQSYNNVQPFFFTVPTLENNEILLGFQKAFVKKILSISLNYDHVLYCLDNETSGAEEWATFWAEFILENAQGNDINVTQMWAERDVKSEMHKRTIDHPDRYRYIDISQNSHNTGRLNWDNAQYVMDYIKDDPRPVNSTKIYGNDMFERWLRRGINSEHSIQTFYRNVIGGFASSRFHRPTAGLGLGRQAVNSITTIRRLEELVKMWEVSPQMDLLHNVEDNEAYLAAEEGEKYVIYFPKSGNVKLDLSQHPYEFMVRWLNTADAQWGPGDTILGGDLVELESYGETGSIAVILKK